MSSGVECQPAGFFGSPSVSGEPPFSFSASLSTVSLDGSWG